MNALYALAIIVYLGILIGIGYTVIHFVLKFW